MTIKDFSPGQTVYILSGKYISERKVKSVGRKYVKIESNWDERFSETDDSNNFLVSSNTWGAQDRLFASIEDYNDYKEQEELKRKLLCDVHSWTQKLSLDQLRRINAIINE